MAQANPEEKKLQGNQEKLEFKFNAHAPEFVPRSQTQMPMSAYFYPYFQVVDGNVVGSDWLYVGSDQDSYGLYPSSNVSLPNCSKNCLNDDLQQKITKQVEYLFSDLSLLANDAMAKNVAKDHEGYVQVASIASMKKIKILVNNNHALVVQAVRSSSKLVLSNDCKKVKRRIPFTESYKEDLQCRTVVAENLPEDHSYQNLEKIFNRVGSVKAIRLCHPPEANASRSKSDVILSNKLHAFVEYDTANIAERAAEQLSDERDWRKGLRVRVLMRCSPKSVLKTRKSDFEIFADDLEHTLNDQSLEDFSPIAPELAVEINGEEHSTVPKKGSPRGRGKTKGRFNDRGLLTSPSLPSNLTIQCDLLGKQKGPRMPDGTRGFTMGRGRPLRSQSSAGCLNHIDHPTNWDLLQAADETVTLYNEKQSLAN
ncbi:hypothetical protein V2J09_002120 [Rumex salicifolius]